LFKFKIRILTAQINSILYNLIKISEKWINYYFVKSDKEWSAPNFVYRHKDR